MPQAINPVESRPYVVAWVDGKPLRLAIDTGASQNTVLFSEVVKSLGGKIQGKGPLQTTRLQALVCQSTNDQMTDDQVVVESPSAGFEGLLGWPLLQQFIWHFNCQTDEQQFLESIPFLVKNKEKRLSLYTEEKLPYVRNKEGLKILLDTGAPYGIYLSPSRWKQWKAQNPYAFITLYSGFSPAAGGYYSKECARVKSYSVAGVELGEMIIAESFIDNSIMGFKKHTDITLGFEALRQRSIWLDGPKKHLYLSSKKADHTHKQELNLLGATFKPSTSSPSYPQITVLKNSVAWRAGLRTGDTLIRLNGQRDPSPELMEYLSTQPGAKALAIIQRKGAFKRISWYLPSEASLTPTPPPPPALDPSLSPENTPETIPTTGSETDIKPLHPLEPLFLLS